MTLPQGVDFCRLAVETQRETKKLSKTGLKVFKDNRYDRFSTAKAHRNWRPDSHNYEKCKDTVEIKNFWRSTFERSFPGLWLSEGVNVRSQPDIFFLIWEPQNFTPEFTLEFTPEKNVHNFRRPSDSYARFFTYPRIYPRIFRLSDLTQNLPQNFVALRFTPEFTPSFFRSVTLETIEFTPE